MNTEKKIHGTTLFIGKTSLKTIFGTFMAYTYQDIIDSKYIMALVYGNVHEHSNLYIRVHSSCLTSETLRSMDCDCVNQLYGSMNKIAEKGAGILFYLMQSGRGASYISKSRGCQLVQYNQDKITTFQAYESMGLKHDYRDYRNVYDVCVMMNIQDIDLYLMTNNPDKIQKLNQFNLNIKDIISLHFPPNPYNKPYLLSKQQTGHLLCYTKTSMKPATNTTLPSVKPFEPYHLDKAQRFIHCSTYYLPIKPVENKIILTPDQYEKYCDVIVDSELLSSGNFLSTIMPKDIPNDVSIPYWFKTHVYYDIATHSEYIVLTFGDDSKIPIVRFHCEFIFNRFPLENTNYKHRYKRAVLMSVKNNSGIIIIANHNGNNTSIGNYILQNEAFELTGISSKKNLLPLTLLLKHHLNYRPIRILYSDTSRPEIELTFEKADIDVKEWICINKTDKKGHSLLRNRIDASLEYLNKVYSDEYIFPPNSLFWVTGIGSSESHAKFFMQLAHKHDHFAQYVHIDKFNDDFKQVFDLNKHLIIISQGLSPHSLIPLEYALKQPNCDNVFLLTSITQQNKNKIKVQLLEEFSDKGGNIINFPLEDEYIMLMRVIGPLSCYFLIYHLFSNGSVNNSAIIEKIKKIEYQIPSSHFTKSVVHSDNIIIIVPQKILDFCVNIKYKFIEGAFIKTAILTGDMDFAHGTYQFCKSLKDNEISVNVLLVNNNNHSLQTLVCDEFNTKTIDTYYDNELEILELEHLFNAFVLNLILEKNIDQINWPGKNTQKCIYNI